MKAEVKEEMKLGGQGEERADVQMNAEDEVQELDKISSIALLIDDLSHEDPSIKINALSKLTNIAELIGEARTRDELVPLVTEMIDKIDENAELMVVLAEQLGLLVPLAIQQQSACIGPREYLPILLKPLEMIASSDESVVREKTVESICKIAGSLSKEQHTSELFPLVKKMAKGDSYMTKISATGLFSAVYPNVSTLNQTMLRQFYTDLCKDDTPMVRRAAAANFPKFAQTIDPYFVKSEFVGVIQALIGDVQDSVKVAAIECAAKVIAMLKNDEVSNTLLPTMKTAADDKKSWRLRFTLAEITTSIISYISKKLVDELVLPWLTILITDTEPEVRSQSLLELIELSKYCTISLLSDKIMPTLNGAIVKDPSEHVRASLANVICGVGENICKAAADKKMDVSAPAPAPAPVPVPGAAPGAVPGAGPQGPLETYIVPICIALSKDENIDVRLSLFQSIHCIIQTLTNAQIDAHILPLLTTVANDKQWRVRMEVVKYLPELSKKVDATMFKEKIMKLFMNFLADPAYLIREEATKNMLKLGEIMGKDWLEEQILAKINEFKVSPDYLLRTNAMLFVSRLKDSLSADFINLKLFPIVLSMKADPVPNIRFNVAKCIEASAKVLSEENLKKEAIPALQQLLTDTDFDVKYFAEKALQHERIRSFCFQWQQQQ